MATPRTQEIEESAHTISPSPLSLSLRVCTRSSPSLSPAVRSSVDAPVVRNGGGGGQPEEPASPEKVRAIVEAFTVENAAGAGIGGDDKTPNYPALYRTR